MSEKVSFIDSRESSYPRMTKIQALLAGVVFAVGGCKTSDADPTETLSEGGFQPIDGTCDPSDLETAEDCLQTYNGGEIALVNYVLASEAAKNLASDTTAVIETSTGGMLQLDITVIEPSQAARDMFQAQIAIDGCVDGNEIEDFASYAADATMDLADYDAVIGVTNEKSCTDDVNGSVNGTHHRYGDLFEVVDDENNSLPHEILHTFKLGHFGNLEADSGLNDYFGRSIDLPTYVKEAIYQEYGSENIMGAPVELSRDSTMTPSQIYLLEWPQRQLNQEARINAVNLAEQPAILNADDASTIAIVELNTWSYSTLDVVEGFDRLIFEPRISDGNVQAVEALLVSGNDDIASLGLLSEIGLHELMIGDGVVTIELTGEVVNISYEATD